MDGRRRWAGRLAWIAALALVSRAVGAWAGPEPLGEKEFLASLERAKALIVAGDAKSAKKATDDLLAKHTGRDYARARRADLEDLVTRIAFRTECPPPDPQTLVKGTLKKYVSKTGEVEIHYLAGKPTDLVASESGRSLGFPADFAGPYTITVRGARYPRTAEASPSIGVVVGATDPKSGREQMWKAYPGVPPYSEGNQQAWLPARVVWYDGEEEKVVVEKETAVAKPGEPWKFEVKVTREKVIASYNNKTFGTASKPSTIFGFAWIGPAEGWDEIVVEGIVQPSWIQRKVDLVVEKARAEFEQRFDVKSALPAWVYESGPAPAPSGETTEATEDDDVPADLREEVVALMQSIQNEPASRLSAFDDIKRLKEKGLPDGWVAYLTALASLAIGDTAGALKDLDRTLKASPNRLDVLILKATLLLDVGREDEGAAAWKAAVLHPKADADLHVAASLALLLAGRLDGARAVTENAARRGFKNPAIDAIGRLLVQAANGPTWPRTFQAKTANYHVCSDIDEETCRRAAQVLEESLAVYRNQVRALKSEKPRLYRVYLFSGKAGFLNYYADVSPFGRNPLNAAGLYSGLLKQLLIWNLPDRDQMMEVVRHEGFHQYLDRLLPDPPVWFNEGMATYFESMEGVTGAWKTGKPRADDLALLAEKGLLPLAKFLYVEPEAFYGDGHRSYAQAWLLVHMMRHGQGKHRDLYRALLTQMETKPADDAVCAVFTDKVMETLDAELEAYRASLAK